jgi:glycerol-3-phosphate dehydrogenase
MVSIRRDLAAAERERHDLIIVGGGVYGAAVLLEAARRGLRGVLVERGDFAGATSSSPLRIVHGGLRYLQRLDLPRHRESVQERSWLLRELPELVEPLACLMPLYRGSLLGPLPLRVALRLDGWLSHLAGSAELPAGEVVPPARVRALFPAVAPGGLIGGALWHDAAMQSPTRVAIEMLRAACARGADALNYVEAEVLLRAGTRVGGVRARDCETGREFEISGPVVVNAAGPWSRALAARWDRDEAALFRPTRAWNLLLDVPPPAPLALAATAPGRGRQTFFLVPAGPRLLAGTAHAPASGSGPEPTAEELAAFVAEVAAAAPGLDIRPEKVLRVFSGELPGRRAGAAALALRPVVVDHGERGGPHGLWSLSGVKFTTARRVAARLLARVFPDRAAAPGPAFDPAGAEARARRARLDPAAARAQPELRRALHTLSMEEAVVHLDDLLLRRTGLGDDPVRALALAPELASLLEIPAERRAEELARVGAAFGVAPAGAPPADWARSAGKSGGTR